VNYKPILIYREVAKQDSDAELIVVRDSESQPPPPFDDLLALNIVMAPVQGLDQIDQYDGFASREISKENMRRATKTMREQINESDIVDRKFEKVADVIFRVSGVALSAGSLAWLLQGGSLFASALSSIPSWQGFDPLPVLPSKRESRQWRFKKQEKSQVTVDKEEAAVGQILDSVKNNNAADSQRNREGHL
jgi:hypothetical protein